ncbi:MAG: alpha-amylase [Burkholderiales bacterium]|nr:alpha-amylase [Phycisphaerae bacterium]
MPSVCLYFQLHQPYRLRRYSVFDTDRHYFDDFKNAEILRKIAARCYLPTNQVILDQIREHDGRFRVAYSISGVLLEQFEEHAPEVLASFKKLASTGCVEFLNETYYHSLAFLYSREEFRQQVDLHRKKIKQLFNMDARVFRNTELIYNNELAQFVAHMGYDGCLAEGADSVLGTRSPNVVYEPPNGAKIKLLLKNYRLSDDIAFRFSDKTWEQHPLTAEKFADWVSQIDGHGNVCNLFMDYETFGEHQWADTGILEFLKHLPGNLLSKPQTRFLTPTEVVDTFAAVDQVDVAHITSWADSERDLSAWLGNAMQSNALHELFKLEGLLRERGDEQLLADWRKLGSSDHFYYMCTKFWADGEVHRYFSPYESPYDSYINFMNVLDNIGARARG